MSPPGRMGLVELVRCNNRMEAELVRLNLQSRGIEALLFDDGLSMAFGGSLPVRLMVLDEDRAAAQAVLDEDEAL